MKIDFGFNIENKYFNMSDPAIMLNHLAMFIIFSATFWNFLNGSYSLATIELIIGSTLLLSYLTFLQNENLNFFLISNTTIFLITTLGYYFTTEDILYASIVLFMFPIIAFLLTGIKIGIYFIIIYITILIGHMISVEKTLLTNSEYLYILVGTIFFSLIAYTFEENRKEAFSKISESMQTLEKISYQDSLSQVYNRHYLNSMLYRGQLDNKPLLFCITDIDNFKAYNDFYGHYKGDEVIKSIAKTKEKVFSDTPEGFIVRLGGEEFGGFICNETDPKNHLKAFKESIKNLSIEHLKNTPNNRCTVSIGAVYFQNSSVLDFSKLYQVADDALYEAKRKGKNQIILKHYKNDLTTSPECVETF